MKKLISSKLTNAAVSLIAISFYGIGLTSCNKQPAADFTTDKTEYVAGETVKCSNTSEDASSYKWTFPDNQTSALKDVDYILSESTPEGSYSIKLSALSKKGNKTSEATKIFTVKAAKGQLTVWTSNSAGGQINVKVDNISYGLITLYYNSNPGCAANGCVTINLTVGQHSLTATDGISSWSSNVIITKNQCKTLELQ